MKRLAAVALALVVTVVIGPPPSAAPSAHAASARPSAVLLEEINLGGVPWYVATVPGAVWIQVDDDAGGPPRGVRVDSATRRVTTTVPNVASLGFGDGQLWAAAFNRVFELDHASGAVLRTIPFPSIGLPVEPAYGSVWVLTFDAHVLRIDPASGQVVADITLPPCPAEVKDITAAFGSVWVSCKGGSVNRVDPTTNTLVATIPSDVGTHSFAAGAEALWVTNYQSNTVSRIDPATNSVTATVRGGSNVGIAFGEGAVWAGGSGEIAKIDPATATVVERLKLPIANFYYGMAFGDGSLWVSAGNRRSLLQIDPLAAAPVRERINARVTATVDGETIRVLTSAGGRLSVSLLGIDGPGRPPGKRVECGAREARENLKRVSFNRGRGRRVVLTTDLTQMRTDRRGRLLAYAKVDSGKLLQAEQLRAGWGRVQVTRQPFERLARFRDLQRLARSAKRGVWDTCGGDFHRPAR